MTKQEGKINVREVVQISFQLDNLPGALAKVAKILFDANINVEGMTHSETNNRTVLDHMVVDDIEKARNVLVPHVKSISEERIISFVVSHDSPGFIAKLSKKLGDEFINLETIYFASAGRGRDAVVNIRVEPRNYDKVLRIAKEFEQ